MRVTTTIELEKRTGVSVIYAVNLAERDFVTTCLMRAYSGSENVWIRAGDGAFNASPLIKTIENSVTSSRNSKFETSRKKSNFKLLRTI